MCSNGPVVGIVPHKLLFETSLKEHVDILSQSYHEYSMAWERQGPVLTQLSEWRYQQAPLGLAQLIDYH